MKQNILETIIGFLVIIVAISFLVFAYSSNNKIKSSNTYSLKARFQNVEGIAEGSDVMLAGIKIGKVEEMLLDKTTFFAVLKLSIDEGIKLPKDSQASVTTSGFLGGKFISIAPGSDEIDLVHDDQIKYTQSSLNIEALIGKLMYSLGSK